jgi:hypothetical protein
MKLGKELIFFVNVNYNFTTNFVVLNFIKLF